MRTKDRERISTPPEDTRDRLLRAAIKLFSEHGYEGATLRAICQKAGVNLALVKYHYGDKLALYRAVVRSATDADAKEALLNEALDENADPAEALRQLIHGTLRRLMARKQQSGLQLRLMLNEMVNPTTTLTAEIETGLRPTYDQLRRVVGGVLDLPMDHVSTRLCTHSIMGQVAHYVHARPILTMLWPEMLMSPDQIDMIANHIADFSLAYLATAKAAEPTLTAATTHRKFK